MTLEADTVEKYISIIPEDRQPTFQKLRETILQNIPAGFKEIMNYKMPSYVVPHELYPQGYHPDPKLPLPFISIASQKNFIAFYHMGIYANQELLLWFQTEYKNLNIGKLDMGKSCIRFKNINKIPFELLGELISKMSTEEWIGLYEASR